VDLTLLVVTAFVFSQGEFQVASEFSPFHFKVEKQQGELLILTWPSTISLVEG
jgi:hypothetical protein